MHIDAIEVYHVRHPLISPWKTSFGEDKDVHAVFVRMHSGSHSGWSESSPLYAPLYSPEFAAGAYALVKQILAPSIVGREIPSARALNDLLALFKGNFFAKAALEIAWWTLEADLRRISLRQLLGGKRTEVDVGADFGISERIEELLASIAGAVEAGHKRVKLKVAPGRDLDVVRAVRRSFPALTFHVDCNSGYTLESLPMFKEMDQYGLAMIEQPLFHTDLHDHARLQAQLATPICLDESVTSVRAARIALELGACRYVNIKPGRVGGLQNSLDIHDLCRAAGVPCWVGGMLESAVGAGICLALAALDNFTYPADVFPSSRFYRQEICDPPLVLSGPGRMTVPDRPGNPFEPDPDRLRPRILESARIEP